MLIYKSRIFDIHSTSVSSRHPPFEYIGHRGTCAVLLVDARENVGLAAHHRPAIGHTLFELPAASLDDLTEPATLLARELRAELALDLDSEQLKPLTRLFSSPGYSSESVTLFFARLTGAQRGAADALRWFNLEELNKLIHEGELTDLKTVAAITAFQAIVWRGAGDEAP